ncbi:hypothetical protein A2721_00045 [Candidatus Gottesmanbacteria bacterium RIFCSPHIGHO2_01_FULL_47_48]|uniref:Uncharacterized protein n=1 Tax=Candidatus Gottesmanbacteria bacterium RIFCSPHIGHO2_01_FULL_47_48 TaxID=1798381 RepID=A0A1F6A3X8_9BACT|nr:MAG: hypothetical protein A2721_00045 [Candidatus Gottesmanbacteria bacterium RIFCSPHIGHO2_01_FULL_47_48]
MNQVIVSITDFRRNAGAYIDKAIPLTIVKDSRVVGQYTPSNTSSMLSPEERVERVKQLAGGFNFGPRKTADEMNRDYDKMYDEMLPR